MPPRPLADKVTNGWRELASIFEELQGGTYSSRKAAQYLRALANNELERHPLHPLPFLEAHAVAENLPQARMEPHPTVLAVLCPSVPLRAIWRRGR